MMFILLETFKKKGLYLISYFKVIFPSGQVANLSETKLLLIKTMLTRHAHYTCRVRRRNKGYGSRMNLIWVKVKAQAQAHMLATSHKKASDLALNTVSTDESQAEKHKAICENRERNVTVIFHEDLFTLHCIFTCRNYVKHFNNIINSNTSYPHL